MAGDGTETNIFAIPQFWQTSKWLDQLDDATSTTSSSPFFHQLLNDSALKSDPIVGVLDFTAADQNSLFFKLPLDIRHHDENETQPTSDSTSTVPDSAKCDEDTIDLWAACNEAPTGKVGFRTWDAFVTGITRPHQPAFLSEAGPRVYDALLCWSDDPLQLENSGVPVVQTRVYFSALLSLALGHESVFFSRQDGKRSFKTTLPKMRISGYTQQVLQGVAAQSLSCGAMLRRLQTFVQFTYSTYPSRCGVALASCLDQVIQAVQHRVSVAGRNPRSLLELQCTIRDAAGILGPLEKLISQLQRDQADEEVLSLLFHQAYAVEADEEHIREILREIMQRVSVPWIEFLEEWIGTKSEGGIPLSKDNVGEGKGFVKVEETIYTDDFGRNVVDIDFCLDPTKVPQFMPDELMESIFDTGRNLRFIKSFHPGHPLAQPDIISSSQPPKSEWLSDWETILQLEERVIDYRDNLLVAIHESRCQTPFPNAQSLLLEPNPFNLDLEVFGNGSDFLEQRIQASIERFNNPTAGSQPQNTLGRMVRDRLEGGTSNKTKHDDSSPHSTLLPTLSFGGIVSVQAAIVNKESLRLLFESHNVRGHLTLQRNFHLLRNGMFCSLLSHALFDPELETAARKTGVVLQGGVMGLRLGGRDSWPPASSELRLALMGVLSESYRSTAGQNSTSVKSNLAFSGVSDLPGDLSFAVRDLSPEEMDMCMNADSLQALDFLRLSYTTPPELSSVITTVALTQYDHIFKLLLRVLRMLYVVNQLFQDVHGANRRVNTNPATYRFVREAHHFVSRISAYFMDTCIGIPWRQFEDQLDEVQAHVTSRELVSEPDKLRGPGQLRDLHSQLLGRIMGGLFLRKRQQPVMKLLEEIFSCILQYARLSRLHNSGLDDDVDEDAGGGRLYVVFKKKVQVFITVCRGLTEKARSGSKMSHGETVFTRDQLGIGDESMVAQLLMKLDMGDYYCRG